MRQNIIKSLALGATLLLGACGVPEVDGIKPTDSDTTTVAISHIDVEGDGVSFTLTPADAATYEYAVTKQGEDQELVSVDGSKISDVVIDNLEEGATYEIYAVAQGEDGESTTPRTVSFVAGDPFRRALVMKFTGTWCVNCPAMSTIIDRVGESNPDRLAVVAIHNTDHYQFDSGVSIYNYFGIKTLPTVNFNYGTAQTASTTEAEKVLTNALGAMTDEPATSRIDIEATIEGGKLKVTVDTKTLDESTYKLGVVVLEDGIYEPGTSGTIDGYYHHVSRAFLTDHLGDDLTLDGGEAQSSFEIEVSSEWESSNLHICAFTLKADTDGNYRVDNANTTEIE